MRGWIYDQSIESTSCARSIDLRGLSSCRIFAVQQFYPNIDSILNPDWIGECNIKSLICIHTISNILRMSLFRARADSQLCIIFSVVICIQNRHKNKIVSRKSAAGEQNTLPEHLIVYVSSYWTCFNLVFVFVILIVFVCFFFFLCCLVFLTFSLFLCCIHI